MWGTPYGYHAGAGRMQEVASDFWIQRHVPGGLNGFIGRNLDNVVGGNPNPTYGQVYRGYNPPYRYYRHY